MASYSPVEMQDEEIEDPFESNPNQPPTDDVLALLEAYATECNKSRSSKELRDQKRMFRSFQSTVENGYHPAIKLKLKGHVAVIKGWQLTIAFNAVRACLGSGLQTHLFNNEWLQKFFSLDVVALTSPSRTKSKAEKRSEARDRRENEKDIKLSRQKDRRRKQNMMSLEED